MQRIMRIKGPDKTYREPITDFQSLRFTGEVSTLPIIEFEVRKESHGADGLEVDGYIETPVYIGDTTIYDYVIKDIKLTTDGVYSVYAIQDAESLKNEPIGFFTAPGSFAGFINRFNRIMNPKGWIFVIEGSAIRNVQCTLDHNSTIWEAMLELCQQAGVRWYIEQRGEVATERVNAVVFYGVNEFPHSTSIRLFAGINLKGYEREHNTNDVITKICPIGKDRLLLNGQQQDKMEVPPEECWITDTSKYDKIVPAWVDFADIETVSELRAAALAYIQGVNAPYICYSITAIDLARITDDDSFEEFDVGTYVEFLDAAGNVVVQSHIAKLVLDLIDPINNSMDISTTAQSFINSTAEERRKTASAEKQSSTAFHVVQNIDDYVVETGSEGIYTWQKWASGKSVLLGYYHGTNTHYSTISSFYSRYFDWGVPEGVFKDPLDSDDHLPNADASGRIGTGFAIPAGVSYANGKLRTYMLSSASGSQPCAIWLRAEGKWK